MANSRGKRFRDRQLELFDLINRFEAEPASRHAHDAIAAIERLELDGTRLFKEDRQRSERWKRGCKKLSKFIKLELDERRFLRKQDLETVLREFFAEFEHTMPRSYQMLYGADEYSINDIDLQAFCSWRELVFRSATYAIVSHWIDEKSEEIATHIKMQFTSGDPPKIRTEETHSRKPMRKPKEQPHRRGMKRL